MADLNQQEVQQLMQSFAQLSNAFQNGQRGVGDYADAQRQAANEIQTAFNNASAQIRGAAISYTKALFDSQEGVGKYAQAAQGAGSAAWELGKNFGALGVIAGGLIKIFGEVAAASLKQADNMMKAYREFADAGALGPTLGEVVNNLHRVGLATDQYEKFSKVLSEVSPTLATFGNGVSTGLQKYVKTVESMIRAGKPYELQAAKLGYDLQGLRLGVAGYLQIQTRLGNGQKLTQEDIEKGSMKYLTTLRELQEYTGMSRDEAKKKIDEQLSNYRWANFINKAGKDAEKSMEFMSVIQQYGQQAFQGASEFIVNGGRVVGEQSSQTNQAFNNRLQSAYQKYMSGAFKNIGELGDYLQEGAKKNLEVHKHSVDVAGSMMDSIVGDEQFRLKVLEQESRKKSAHEQKVLMATMTYDQKMAYLVGIEQKNRAANILKDKTLEAVGNSVIEMFSKLQDITLKLLKSIAKAIDWLTARAPHIFGQKTNLAEGFKDKDDFKADLAKATQERDALLAQKNSIQGIQTGDAKQDALKLKEAQINQRQQDLADKSRELQREIFASKQISAAMNPEEKKIAEAKIASLDNEVKNLEQSTLNLDEERKLILNGKKVVTQEQVNALKNAEINVINEKIAKKDLELQQLQKELNATGPDTKGQQVDRSKALQKNVGETWDKNASGEQVSENVREQRKQSQVAIGQLGESLNSNKQKVNEILNKLNFGGSKSERTGGGQTSGSLVALADRIHSEFKGGTFTAMNDVYHQKNNPKSKHTQGKALDYVPPVPPKDAYEAAEIKEQLKALGATLVKDEYFTDKDNNTKGGHFHIEVAHGGGKFNGSKNKEFPVLLQTKESVWREDQIRATLAEVKKSSIEEYKKELMRDLGLDKSSSATLPGLSNNNNEVMMDMIATLTDKFDSLISISNQSRNIQDELLTYTRA